MGKVILINQGRRMDTVAVANGIADPFLFRRSIEIPIAIGTETFIMETSEREEEEIMNTDICKRIAYDLMQEEVSTPLVKPMWPLSF